MLAEPAPSHPPPQPSSSEQMQCPSAKQAMLNLEHAAERGMLHVASSSVPPLSPHPLRCISKHQTRFPHSFPPDSPLYGPQDISEEPSSPSSARSRAMWVLRSISPKLSQGEASSRRSLIELTGL